MKKSLILFSLLVVAFVSRFGYAASVPNPLIAGDTYGYYNIGNRILRGEVTPWFYLDQRPPVYPLFFSGLMWLSGRFYAYPTTPEFYDGARVVVMIQSLLGIVSVLVFFDLCRLLKLPVKLGLVLSFLYAGNVWLFTWEHVLVTESVVVFWLLVLTHRSMILMQHSDRLWHWILFGLLSVTGFLLKPIYIGLPLLLLGIFVSLLRTRRVLMRALWVGALFTLVPLSVIAVNRSLHGYGGISHVGDINVLGRIMQFHLPLESGQAASPFFYEEVGKYLSEGATPVPYQFIEERYPQLLLNPDYRRLEELRKFTQSVVVSNLPSYVARSLMDMPLALLSPPDTVVVPSSALYQMLWQLYGRMRVLTLPVIILFPVAVLHYLRRRTREGAVLLIVGGIGMYQLVMTVLFGYGEFGRIMGVALPELFLFIAAYVMGWVVLVRRATSI